MRLTKRAMDWAGKLLQSMSDNEKDAFRPSRHEVYRLEQALDALLDRHEEEVLRAHAEGKALMFDRLHLGIDFGKRGLELEIWIITPNGEVISRREPFSSAIRLMEMDSVADEATLRQFDKAIDDLKVTRARVAQRSGFT